jgi:hypothetical protein
MPDLPISQLPELTGMTSDAEFAVSQNGVTYKVKAGNASSGNLHGAFHSEVTQYIVSANTEVVMSASTTDYSEGITISDGGNITISSGGTYNLQFSSVFKKIQGGAIEFISVWPKINGNNVPWSNTDVTMANNNELIVAAWNFVLELNPGDVITLMWSSTSTQMQMVAIPPQVNPDRPGTPSVIITVTQI